MRIEYEMTLEDYIKSENDFRNAIIIKLLVLINAVSMLYFVYKESLGNFENIVIHVIKYIILTIGLIAVGLTIWRVLEKKFNKRFREKCNNIWEKEVGRQLLIIDDNKITYLNNNSNNTFCVSEILKISQRKKYIYLSIRKKEYEKENKDLFIMIPKNKLSYDEINALIKIKSSLI